MPLYVSGLLNAVTLLKELQVKKHEQKTSSLRIYSDLRSFLSYVGKHTKPCIEEYNNSPYRYRHRIIEVGSAYARR